MSVLAPNLMIAVIQDINIETMEVPFDVDIDLDEDIDRSNDDCEIHNDYDNQKLFHVFECYLKSDDISDTESEPDLSFNDHFNQMMTKRVAKSPQTPKRQFRRISCFADIENQKSISKKTPLNDQSMDQSFDESMSEPSLPWTLNDMNEQQIIDLVNKLDEQLIDKETNYPSMVAKHMKNAFDKKIQCLNDMISGEEEEKFKNSLQPIGVTSGKERINFNELISEQLMEMKSKSNRLSKLSTDLEVIQKLSNK